MSLSVFREYYFWFEVMAFLAALVIVLSGKRNLHGFKTLPLYLAFIIAMDIISTMQTDRHVSGIMINRLVIPVEFLYVQLLGISLLKNPLFKKIIFLFIGIYFILFAIDWMSHDPKKFRIYLLSYTAGVTGMVAVCTLLYYELMNSKGLLSFFKVPVFWFCTGVLIFYLGTLPIHLYWNLATNKDRTVLLQLKTVFDVLMCVMYSFFTISMLSTLWEKN